MCVGIDQSGINGLPIRIDKAVGSIFGEDIPVAADGENFAVTYRKGLRDTKRAIHSVHAPVMEDEIRVLFLMASG